MRVHITKEFLEDLKEAADPKFVRHVLNHTLADDGTLKPDKDDHRYDGVEDAWIRYVSRGTTAYRVIYIRKGDAVYLYRAGRHDVEDGLKDPKELDAAFKLLDLEAGQLVAGPQASEKGMLLKTTEAMLLSAYLRSMYHYRHNEIYIIAPFIDFVLLDRQHHFGKFLDRAIEEGTVVMVITTPQQPALLPALLDLEKRDINVFFFEGLHTKLYVFDIDLTQRVKWQQSVKSAMVIGSSNFTFPGIGFDDKICNEELCYSLPSPMLEEIRTYAVRLMKKADDYNKFAFKIARSQRK